MVMNCEYIRIWNNADVSSFKVPPQEILLYMSIGQGNGSELRPPAGVLFVHQVISEHGERRWNDIDRGNS
jgi:hypothetical protein